MALIKCNVALMCCPIVSGLKPKTFYSASHFENDFSASSYPKNAAIIT